MAKNIQQAKRRYGIVNVNYTTSRAQSEVLMSLGLDKETCDFWSDKKPAIHNIYTYPRSATDDNGKFMPLMNHFIPHWSFEQLTKAVFPNMDWTLNHEGDEYAFELENYEELTSWESTAINAVFEVAKKYLEQKVNAFKDDELF